MRLQVITDRQERDEERNAERFSSMENLLDSKLTMMQLMMEKNLAQYQAIISEMRAENSELRGEMNSKHRELRGEMNSKYSELSGEIKAIAAQMEMLQTKMGWYISFLGIWLTLVVALSKLLLK